MNVLSFRDAEAEDVDLYFRWANDALVRKNSINTGKIALKDHIAWFSKKLKDPNVNMYVFFNSKNEPVGQVIIEIKENWSSIGQSVALEHRGKKYSTEMLTKSTNDFLRKHPKKTIVSVVKSSNIASLKMSKKSGLRIIPATDNSDVCLVLKGYQQHDDAYVQKSMGLFNL